MSSNIAFLLVDKDRKI